MPRTISRKLKSFDGTLLHYELSSGSFQKPTLFFLHGLGGDLDAWKYVKRPLRDLGYSTIAMDLRGHGFSDHPARSKSYEIDNLAQDVVEISSREKVGKIVLIGHCWGAMVSLNFAINFPQKLKGLVVVSGSFHPPLYLNSSLKQTLATGLINLMATLSPKLVQPRHSYYPAKKFHKDYEWLGLAKTIMRNSLKSYLLSSKQIVNLNLENKLKKIKMPTLIISGSKDSIFPLSISRKMHTKIQNSKLEVVDGANHVVILNNPIQVYKSIKSFLKILSQESESPSTTSFRNEKFLQSNQDQLDISIVSG